MNKRILYIEDNSSNMLLVQRILQAMDIDMLQAFDGESGLRLAEREQPDLLMVDINLPGGIDGIEVIRRVRASSLLNGVPIIVLTAHGDEETEKSAIAAGSDAFLHKPADIRQIRAAINQFMQ